MKNITISHNTALKVLRKLRTGHNALVMSDKIWEILETGGGVDDRPVDLLVHSKNESHIFRHAKSHVLETKIPKNSTFELYGDVSCVTHEMLLVQMAKKMHPIELSMLVMEFCGMYAIYDDEENPDINQPAATSIGKIKRFVSAFRKVHPRMPGLNKLDKVLDFCKDNAASPMETKLFILLAGPRSMGLYGCKGLVLNQPVQLNDDSAKIADQYMIFPDISNPKKKVAIEYDSKKYHENDIQGQRDKRRREGLVNQGWKVYSIVPAQLYDIKTFDLIARNILCDLGQSNRIRREKFNEHRAKAFKLLGL